MTEGKCPECNHAWAKHRRTADGGYACTYHGCGCRELLPDSDEARWQEILEGVVDVLKQIDRIESEIQEVQRRIGKLRTRIHHHRIEQLRERKPNA